MQHASWYLRRLTRMSGAEVAYRVGRTLRTVSVDLVPAAVPPRDEFATDFRFLPPFVALSPEALLAAADRALAGRFTLFDLDDCDLGDPPQWNRDPLTHRVATSRRASRFDYQDERAVVSIKYLWEANRHLHLPVLAQAYVITGDARYALGIRQHVDSWIEQCPVGRGPNWCSALELGIRLINWSLAWQLIGGARSRLFQMQDGVDFRERWLRSVYEHARSIVSNLSRFSSANHHLIGEAAGVYVAASTWPLWPEVREWGERCRQILDDECQRQNAPDGGNREQAFAYQAVVLDFLIIAGLAARARGEDLSPLYWRRIEAMIEFLASLADVAGRIPQVGDGDDACVVRLAPEPGFSPHGSLIATGAVIFERPDLAVRAGTLDSKTMTLLGVQAARRLTYLKSRARAGFRPRQRFSESGYYLLGTAFGTPDEVRLLVDAGPLGYLSLAAHGHADALAFTLGIGDREILIDPGTYTFQAEPAWRRYFRSTLAHNTVEIDGADQSQQSGSFMWSGPAGARCIEFDATPGLQRFVGEHDGYARLADPLLHRREIVFEPGRAVIDIGDTLRCEGGHTARRAWHFAEDCAVQRAGDGLRIVSGHTQLLMEPLEPLERVDIHRGGSAEQGGWISRRFGRKQPCTTVLWHSHVAGVTVLRTRITYARSSPLGL
jgi:hypothetical protein